MATDWIGGRPIFTALLATTAIPLLLLCVATQYWQYLVLGLFIGMAGTTFAVGIAYTSAWFPQRLQGTALGIFGAGNTGASLTKLFAPALMTVIPAGGLGLIPGGWRFVPFVYAVAVLVTAAIYWTFTYTDHSHHKQETVRQLLSPLKHMRVWRFSLYYFLVFGGYVALSLWLPKYYIDVFGLSLRDAALLAAIFVFPSGIIRAPGGWLSDRYGARTVMYWVLSICVVTTFLLSFPDVDLGFIVPAKYVGAGAAPHLSLRMSPTLFTVIVFVLGIAMGIGKAAVFKHIPHYFPDKVGFGGRPRRRHRRPGRIRDAHPLRCDDPGDAPAHHDLRVPVRALGHLPGVDAGGGAAAHQGGGADPGGGTGDGPATATLTGSAGRAPSKGVPELRNGGSCRCASPCTDPGIDVRQCSRGGPCDDLEAHPP